MENEGQAQRNSLILEGKYIDFGYFYNTRKKHNKNSSLDSKIDKKEH